MKTYLLTTFAAASLACAAAPSPVNVPELMRTYSGGEVKTLADWEGKRAPEILERFTSDVYGRRPDVLADKSRLAFEVTDVSDALDGRAVRKLVKVTFNGPHGRFSFPFTVFIPRVSRPAGAFVFICNRPVENIDPDRKTRSEFWPVEEIVSRGYATAAFQFGNVAPDDAKAACQQGIFAAVEKPADRTPESWGSISAWAWAASRIMDWIETEPLIDSKRVAVVGHSRGGKTSLWTAVTDKRFAMACVNESGCSGAKLNHIKLPKSEPIEVITRVFPHWFCAKYRTYAGKDMTMDFDTHQLAALVAPRLLAIGDASEDHWAGQLGEWWTARLASPAWELYGRKGFTGKAMAKVGEAQQGGNVSFHLRKGRHNLLVVDWRRYMDFADAHGWAGEKPVADVRFKIGVAGYSFHKRTLDESLEIMKKIDCRYLCHKDFFLKYNASDDEISAYRAKCYLAGVETLATGPLYAKDEATLRAQFEFAKKAGIKVLVGVPYEVRKGKKDAWGPDRIESDKMLDVIEKLVKEYDMYYAIHNHGPDIPNLYPTGESIMKRIAHRDRRIGVCFDIGHQARAGLDPVKFIREHSERIFDVHIKNIKIDRVRNLAMEGPRGELDIPAVFQALADVGYEGVCHIEYEKDFEDNALGLAESMGYYRGVADCIQPKAVMKSAPKGANTLTAAEKADGWQLLWDGKTLNGWVGVKNGFKAPPAKGWVIKDGTLTMLPMNGITPDGNWFPLPPEDQKLAGGGDIVTVKKYTDFAFKFDFRLTRAANSGVKYFYDEKQNNATCEEYQILEDGHPDSSKGRNGNRRAAALYDIFPTAGACLKGIGEWNSGMIVSKGSKVEHWLNGVKVLEYDRATKAFKDGVNASKYAKWGVGTDGKPQPWGEIKSGRILLQDHSDSTVSFCNLKIKEL